MVFGDKLRQALLWEETEDVDSWDALHDDKYQNEFIFKLFQHIFIGGPLCQYETNIGEYLSCVKSIYKDLVTVAKDPDTQEIKCFTHAFRIDQIGDYKHLFSSKDQHHAQNGFYVLVDPINWHVNFYFNQWEDYW